MDINNKRPYIYFPVFSALILIAGIYLGSRFVNIGSSSTDIFSINPAKYDKINDIINYIDESYVDTVNNKKLTEEAINGMLQSLDPHSYYIPAEDFNQVNDPLMGNFEGIGIQFRIQKDTVVVLNTIAGGPSEKVGVRAGDRIVKVEGNTIAGIKISNEEVIKKLKGKQGTKVNISILRNEWRKLIDFTIIRDVIPTYSVDIAYMVKNSLGYIKISTFAATTYDEFMNALSKLKKQGLKKLILDLRSNGGGYMDAATRIADEFLENKKLIVYTEGRARPKKYIYATRHGDFENGELIVLLDDWSASASEILAGAIQDNDRGLIIGRRSFGKGLVQEQIKLPDGSAIRLTVARYHTPTGRCIQKSYENGTERYDNELYKRFLDGEMEHPDSIHFPDSLKYKTPKGKIVYGGGGIMPDIYVTVDTAENSEYFTKLFNRGLIYEFSFNYVDKNRNKLKRFRTFEFFNKYFNVTESLLNEFVLYAEKEGINKDEKGLKISGDLIKIQLKAYIARNLFEDNGFYPVIHKIDNTFKKAVDVLSQ